MVFKTQEARTNAVRAELERVENQRDGRQVSSRDGAHLIIRLHLELVPVVSTRFTIILTLDVLPR